MAISFLKMIVKLAPEISHLAGMSQTMDIVQRNIREMSLSYIAK
jgi:hypothetical protein